MPISPDEVLYCSDLDQAIALLSRFGLRLDTIFPADDPSVAVLSGPGGQVRLVRVPADAAAQLSAAGSLEPEDAGRDLERMPASQAYLVVHPVEGAWRTGRAGMQYRDLIPYQLGGRYIASHIRIPAGGPVADYVHFHAIRLQLIYCYRGWVRVVYEGQGEPFVMHAGDCVLQPPRIRHRVLEASPGLEVIELAVPALHATHVDHECVLPSATPLPGRDHGGQRFVRHVAANAQFTATELAGLEACELGIAEATRGLASARVLRARASGEAATPGVSGRAARVECRHDAALMFHFVLRGAVTLDGERRLGAADAFVIPADRRFVWSDASPDLALLQVALPGTCALELVTN